MSDTPSHWAMQVAVPFVTEQSLGEWGDETVEADATKLALLLDRVVAEEREKCAKEIEEHFRCCTPKGEPLNGKKCCYEAHGIELGKCLRGEGGEDE